MDSINERHGLVETHPVHAFTRGNQWRSGTPVVLTRGSLVQSMVGTTRNNFDYGGSAMHKVLFYPVGNGDTSQVILENGKRFLFDFCHRVAGEDPEAPLID